tara:strand:+ start:790 stop:1266 length:477 start_codon:yes stop_codon:yes gene_type:complete
MGTVKTDSFSTTYSNEQYALGSLRTQPADEVTAADASLKGDRVWMFVKASSAGFSANDLLERDSTSDPFQAKTSSASAALKRILLVGVADHAIAANQYGWVIVQGACVVKTASVSAGNTLCSKATAGTAEAASTGGAVFGYATSATSGGLSDAYIDLQ